MYKKNFLGGSFNIINGFRCIKVKMKFKKDHPEYFDPCGLLTWCGEQGCGKTISLVNYVRQLVDYYPKVVIVSNIKLIGFPEHIKIIYYQNISQLFKLFDEVHNGYAGVIYIVDEIQVLFHALLKRSYNVETLETISQQRKQRKHILGTAQVYKRIDKVFREQMNRYY